MRYGLRDRTDGTSNTVAFGEALCGFQGNSRAGTNPPSRYRGNYVQAAGSGGTDQVFDVNTIGTVKIQADLQTCAAAFLTSSNIADYRGWRWSVGCPGFTMFNTVQTPNEGNNNGCRWDCGAGCNMDNSIFNPATSNHSGGVNVLMGDGSVRFIKNSINRTTWWALGTKGNGEVIDASSY